ncbi:hypothetical protein TNCV_3681681 [Trichonephila clavipes]|uniref:Uncharacterized protein n=1 Tax=Trichonephila clavipes TaxID=2585209 RepID=A0A8X6RFG2_TRICX|nr:hypothetical protein TNCV_3681681 [Trichonephila clavipes]
MRINKFIWYKISYLLKRVSWPPRRNDRHRVEAVTGLFRYYTILMPVIQRIGERMIPYSWRTCEKLRHFECDGFVGHVVVSDGLVAFEVDIWCHDCCGSFARPGSPTKEEFDLGTFRSGNEYLSLHAKTIVTT